MTPSLKPAPRGRGWRDLRPHLGRERESADRGHGRRWARHRRRAGPSGRLHGEHARLDPRFDVGLAHPVRAVLAEPARAEPPAVDRPQDRLGADLAALGDVGGSQEALRHQRPSSIPRSRWRANGRSVSRARAGALAAARSWRSWSRSAPCRAARTRIWRSARRTASLARASAAAWRLRACGRYHGGGVASSRRRSPCVRHRVRSSRVMVSRELGQLVDRARRVGGVGRQRLRARALQPVDERRPRVALAALRRRVLLALGGGRRQRVEAVALAAAAERDVRRPRA